MEINRINYRMFVEKNVIATGNIYQYFEFKMFLYY